MLTSMDWREIPMHTRHRLPFFASLLMLVALLSFTLAACGGSNSGASSTPTPAPAHLTDVSIAFGYIPDIQFSPFYVAQETIYYKAAALNVSVTTCFVHDLI